jgi:cytochrome c oxidase subunit 2
MFPYSVAPPSASNWASENDTIFYALCVLSVFFTVLVVAFVIFFAVRYRAGSKADRSRPVYEDLRLELTWTFIPLGMALVMFYFGARLYIREKTPPKNAQQIFVIGKQWMWHIQHQQGGVRENNTLHVALGQPYQLTMISQDVIHDFYVPAFRVQWMVVPGRYTTMWFTPTQVGEYHLFCNMYCGTQHSEMVGKVVVMSRGDFTKWLANNGENVVPMTMEQAGARIYNKVGCENCHGAEDNPRAPSLYGIYGRLRNFSNSAPVKADEEYLRESILRPYNKLVKGYGETMPAYEGQLSESDVLNLIAYMKTLGASEPRPVVGAESLQAGRNAMSHTDSNNSLAVNAIAAKTENPDATPTARNTNPAVGSIAARDRTPQ